MTIKKFIHNKNIDGFIVVLFFLSSCVTQHVFKNDFMEVLPIVDDYITEYDKTFNDVELKALEIQIFDKKTSLIKAFDLPKEVLIYNEVKTKGYELCYFEYREVMVKLVHNQGVIFSVPNEYYIDISKLRLDNNTDSFINPGVSEYESYLDIEYNLLERKKKIILQNGEIRRVDFKLK